MAGGEGYPAAVVSDMLLRASDLMPADLRKGQRSKFFQLRGELRRRYAGLLTQSLHRGQPPDERRKRHLDALSQDFYGALGLAEGLMANPQGYPAGVVYGFLQRARELMPSDASKGYQSKFFYLRGILRLETGDKRTAIEDLETAISVWPMADNRALAPLENLYREAGDTAALQAVQDRIRRRRR